MNGFLNGCGRTGFSMVNGVAATFFVRIPLAFALASLLPENLSLYGIGTAAPVATLFSILLCLFYLKSGKWNTCN